MNKEEEVQLASCFRNGDESAFGELYREYNDALIGFLIKRFSLPLNDAEDFSQGAWLKAWQKRESFAGKSRLYVWVSRIACNLVVDAIRRDQRITFMEDPSLIKTASVSESMVYRRDDFMAKLALEDRLHNLINASDFPKDWREILLLKMQGMSQKQIGREMRINQSVVCKQLQLIRSHLASRILNSG